MLNEYTIQQEYAYQEGDSTFFVRTWGVREYPLGKFQNTFCLIKKVNPEELPIERIGLIVIGKMGE